jgi:hypothetical protein
MRTMSTDAIRRRAAELGANFIGPEEWQRILNAAEMRTRRPVLKPVDQEVTTQAELTEDEYRSLFPPIP